VKSAIVGSYLHYRFQSLCHVARICSHQNLQQQQVIKSYDQIATKGNVQMIKSDFLSFYFDAFSAFTLLVGQQEEHPAHKKF